MLRYLNHIISWTLNLPGPIGGGEHVHRDVKVRQDCLVPHQVEYFFIVAHLAKIMMIA